MTIKEQIAEAKSKLAALKSRIEAGDAEAIAEGETLAATINEKTAELKSAEKKASILQALGETDTETKGSESVTLMDQIKAANFPALKTNRGSAAVEVKAATDPVLGSQVVTTSEAVPATVRRARVADLLPREPISGNAIKYFQIGATEGTVGNINEGAKKSQIHPTYTPVTAPLVKHAAYFKESDELLEDLPRLESVMTGRLVDAVEKAEDADIVADILAMSGIGAITTGISFDNLLKAKTQIATGAEMDADAIVINPTDLETLLLSKDGNQQYMLGGPAYAPYGSGQYAGSLPIWGLRVVASTAITAGTALVGAFGSAATLAVKNGEGTRVEASNSNEDDFVKDMITIRGENRSVPAVRKPAAFVKVYTSGT